MTASAKGWQRWLSCALAALIAALAAILGITTACASASASAAGVVETRVGPSDVAIRPLIEPPEHISAGQRLGNDNQQAVTGVAAGVAANAARGLGDLGGVISESGANAAGGRIPTSSGAINQNNFARLVNNGLMRGDDIHILTGVHGLPSGEMIADASLYADDDARFGSMPGVTVHDIASMTSDAISGVLQRAGTVIGGFCDSGACLAPYRRTRRRE